jgi:glycosyltransferase involved in cell wall biosynthesis
MGGIETHCEQLYPRLAGLDESLDITVIGRKGYVQPGDVSGVQVLTLWAPRIASLETVVHTFLALIHARLFLHPDLVHIHAVGPGFFTPLARLLGFKVIGTHHATDYERPKFGRFGRWFLRAGEWMMATFADRVICVSDVIREKLIERRPDRADRFVTIRNGAPPLDPGSVADGAFLASLGLRPGRYILCVGRLDPYKGFHDVIRAFEIARPEGLKLAIVGGSIGSDDYAAELRQAASDGIVFTGARSTAEVQVLYENARLFVHPSYLEGFPMVVLEALAADAPVLVSDIDPHLEIGLDPQSYFPVGDVDALAAALAAPDYDRFHCTRRDEILAENDWDTIARRHREIMIRYDPERMSKRVPATT